MRMSCYNKLIGQRLLVICYLSSSDYYFVITSFYVVTCFMLPHTILFTNVIHRI